VLRLRSYERLLVENRRFRSNGGRLTQNFRYKGSPRTNHSSSQKTRINILSYGIKIWTDLSSVLSEITRVTDRQTDGRTDRRTDRQTDRILLAIPRLHYMQRGKNAIETIKKFINAFYLISVVTFPTMISLHACGLSTTLLNDWLIDCLPNILRSKIESRFVWLTFALFFSVSLVCFPSNSQWSFYWT